MPTTDPIVEPEDHTYVYGSRDDLVKVIEPDFRFIPKDLYRQFVDLMPIVCVDIVAQDPVNNHVLLIRRDQNPLKDVMFFPGGRLLRGETFFGAAVRKLREETGLESTAVKVLTVVNTFFDACEWQTRAGTQTVNVLVHVAVKDSAKVALNQLHTEHKWVEAETKEVVTERGAEGLNRYVLDGLELLKGSRK